MKQGDIVIYSERGEKYVATVLEVRELEFHSGENGEPLLHIGFFAPAYEPDGAGKLQRVKLVGTHRQDQLAQFRLDVAHESHKFPAHLKQPVYPGGRWTGPVEFNFSEEEETAEPESENTPQLEAGSETDPTIQ